MVFFAQLTLFMICFILNIRSSNKKFCVRFFCWFNGPKYFPFKRQETGVLNHHTLTEWIYFFDLKNFIIKFKVGVNFDPETIECFLIPKIDCEKLFFQKMRIFLSCLRNNVVDVYTLCTHNAAAIYLIHTQKPQKPTDNHLRM